MAAAAAAVRLIPEVVEPAAVVGMGALRPAMAAAAGAAADTGKVEAQAEQESPSSFGISDRRYNYF